MSLRVCLAGQLAVEAGGVPVPTAGVGPLGRLALAYLVTERDRPVPRDELADVLWGDGLPRSWETSVRVLVSKLRALLARAGLAPAEALTTRAGCYQLHLPADAAVDVEVAASAVAAAEAALEAGRPEEAQAAATEAAAIAARRFLPGESGDWVERQQAELRAIHLQALEALSAAASAGHDWPMAVQAAEEAISLEPFREQTWVRLMCAHAAAGNRGEALRAYERCRLLLVEELGVGPSPATEAAYAELLMDADVAGPQVPPPGRPPTQHRPGSEAAHPPWLLLPPPLTSFVGREDDLADVAAQLATTRLLTLTGTGGVGKTRLAIQVARDQSSLFADGAVLVELASLTDGRLVDAQVLAALGVDQEAGRTPTATLVRTLQDRNLLLILDNCEHLLAPTAVLVEALLARGEGLTILATSREPLRISAERTLRVRSLSVPHPDAAPGAGLDGLLGFEAVRLFAERAAAASGLRLTDANVEAAARICAELDGIPLALELAAARTGSLSLEDIADRLDDRFPLLASGSRTAPSRQRTLQGAVDWTYEHLSPDQRDAFQRLSVIAGDFSLEAAEHLWAEHGAGGLGRSAVLDLVSSLVDCSVLVADTGRRAARYRLPETMRQYAAAKLAPADADAARSRHLAWATALAERAEEGLLAGGRQAAWLDAVDAEQDNLRAALGWATSEAAPAGAGLPLAAALGRFWEVRGHLSEGRRWLDAATAHDAAAPEDRRHGAQPAVRARALYWAGVLAQRQGDADAASALFQECLVIRRGLGDRAGVAAALHGLGNLAALQGDAATARSFFEECLAIGRELGDEETIAASLANLGWVASNQGDLSSARAFDEESLTLRRRQGDRHGVAMLLGNLGYLAFQEGDFAAARAFDEESLALRQELGDRHGIAMLLGNLGHLAFHHEGNDAAARRLYEESLVLRQELGDRHGEAGSLANLAELARVEGDIETASRLLHRALDLAGELGDRYRAAALLVSLGRLDVAGDDLDAAELSYRSALPPGGEQVPHTTVADWLEGLATVAGARGAAERAARLLGAAATLRRTIGAPVLPRYSAAIEEAAARARRLLGESGFEAAWSAGQRLSLEDAVRYGQSREDGARRVADAAPPP
jgi:predicted ATPase/DNA-binding SARP family transcriptional activator